MAAVRTALAEKLHAESGVSGMTFRRFMEHCLYDAEGGFYSGVEAEIGRAGHFLTSVSISRLFGQIVAQQIHEIWLRLGKPAPFRLIEMGAHDGRLAVDVLKWCRDFAPAFYGCARLSIVEPFPHWRGVQAAAFAEEGMEASLEHAGSLRELSHPEPGVVYCNELLDAFPVPIVRFIGGEWREMRVICEEDACRWSHGPLSTPGLAEKVQGLPLPPIEGYTTEVHDGLAAWLKAASAAISAGAILAFDYGLPEHEYYDPARSHGTIRAYHRHRMTEDVLARPGQQDITAHVNWTELVRASGDAGVELIGVVDQHRFAVGVLEGDLRRMDGMANTARFASAFRAIAHPEGMGSKFGVAGFSKGMRDACGLSGFRYARDSGFA